MRTSKPLLLAIPAMLLGIGVTELTAFSRAGSATLIGQGFKPGVCSIEPPAELLALADWPLDKTGCASGMPAKPPVIEARIRSVSDILAGGGAHDGEFSGLTRGRAPVVSAEVVPVADILAGPTEALALAIAAPRQIEEASLEALGEYSATGPTSHGEAANDANEYASAARDILAAGQSLGETRLQHVARDAQYGDLGGTPARDSDAEDFALPPALLASASVDPAKLDSLRGGFTLPNGLQLSIGIERAVMINGVLQSTTVLRVVDIGAVAITPPTAPTITPPTAPTITPPTAPTITPPTAPTIVAPTAPNITPPDGPAISPPAVVAPVAPSVAPPAAPAVTPPAAPVLTPPVGPAIAAPAAPVITPPTAPAAPTITPPTGPVIAGPAAPTIAATTSPSAPVLVLQPGSNAAPSLPAGTTVAVIQNGPNNSVTTALNSASLATVIQNSLDNQKVQVVTTVDAKVNSAEVLHGIRMQQSLQDALNRSSMQR